MYFTMTLFPDTTISTTRTDETIVNEICNNALWTIVGGDWEFDSADCSLQATAFPESNNLIWLGSADGMTPNNDYSDENFNLTVTMSTPDQGGNAGIVFRMGASDDVYYLNLLPWFDYVRLGVKHKWNGWFSSTENVSVSSIESNTVYTLAVHATGTSYEVYLDGELVMDGVVMSELTNGSIGLATSYSKTTFYSVEYSTSSTAPTTEPTTVSTIESTKATNFPTVEPTTAQPTGEPYAGIILVSFSLINGKVLRSERF